MTAGGLAACGQIESASLGSVELGASSAAYNYNVGNGGSAAASVGSITPAPSNARSADAKRGPQVVASYATTTPASASGKKAKSSSAPTVARSLALPARLQEPAPSAAGPYKVGAPYVVNGKKYTPRHDRTYNRIGLASWYGPDFHGRQTANGEVYDMNALSAAHQTLPLPCYARVTNVKNGRSVIVRVNDRGPFKHNRIIDLSGRAAELLGLHKAGVAAVRVEYVGLAPLAEGVRNRAATSNKPWMAQYADSTMAPSPPPVAALPKKGKINGAGYVAAGTIAQ
jgi:rare lipoprotein A